MRQVVYHSDQEGKGLVTPRVHLDANPPGILTDEPTSADPAKPSLVLPKFFYHTPVTSSCTPILLFLFSHVTSTSSLVNKTDSTALVNFVSKTITTITYLQPPSKSSPCNPNSPSTL
ncbi:hypothetical protein PGT21_022229 [Puccinia graminis f. sp. tritici]|uniref:Uncharacterized protein n=1 Tax=Puccinia graminis f. sp. tritici TaxID=56615 RepID=A0A5B0PIK7_PUCGR|nr:hypothetical protein PGT21_022229 [Puccinia graminis f. sp. tritici]